MSILSKVTMGVAGLGLLGLGGYLVAAVPSPLSAGVEPPSSIIAPDAVTRSLICSGDVVGYLGDSAEISSISGTTRNEAGVQDEFDLAMGDGTNGSVISNTGDSLFVAASEFDAVRTELVSGYLATECGDAMNDQWLVGGSTTTGRDTILTISNGSDVEARVDLEIWGSTGLIDAPGSRGIVIPPKSQRSYSVAGFAPDEPSPAVHLTSSGAAVWATLQTTAVRGLVAGGLDRIGPVAEATTAVHFPILRIPDEEDLGEVLIDPSYADIVPAIRLLVPGETDAAVTITIDPFADGDPQIVTASITAGATIDIPLAELEPGDFSVTIESDQPLVAAARVGSHDPKSGITDIAWASAAPPHKGMATLVSPTVATLALFNPGNTEATVTVIDSDLITPVTIPAHGTHWEPIGPGLVSVKTTSVIATSVFISTADGIATIRGLTAPIDAGNVVVIND